MSKENLILKLIADEEISPTEVETVTTDLDGTTTTSYIYSVSKGISDQFTIDLSGFWRVVSCDIHNDWFENLYDSSVTKVYQKIAYVADPSYGE